MNEIVKAWCRKDYRKIPVKTIGMIIFTLGTQSSEVGEGDMTTVKVFYII